jgi:hypothetical protein
MTVLERRGPERRGLARGAALLLAGALVGLADVRFDRVDVVPDPLGLLLWAVGLDLVRRAAAGDRAAAGRTAFAEAAVLAAAVVAVADVPGPLTGDAAVLYLVLGAAANVATAVALSRVLAVAGDARLARLWSFAAALLAVGAVLSLLAVTTTAADDGAALSGAALVWGLVLWLWHLALLARTWQFARR